MVRIILAAIGLFIAFLKGDLDNSKGDFDSIAAESARVRRALDNNARSANRVSLEAIAVGLELKKWAKDCDCSQKGAPEAASSGLLGSLPSIIGSLLSDSQQMRSSSLKVRIDNFTDAAATVRHENDSGAGHLIIVTVGSRA